MKMKIMPIATQFCKNKKTVQTFRVNIFFAVDSVDFCSVRHNQNTSHILNKIKYVNFYNSTFKIDPFAEKKYGLNVNQIVIKSFWFDAGRSRWIAIASELNR